MIFQGHAKAVFLGGGGVNCLFSLLDVVSGISIIRMYYVIVSDVKKWVTVYYRRDAGSKKRPYGTPDVA